MGEGDLWDDSVLIRAFDNAVSKYKIMHKMSGSNVGEKANIINTEETKTLPAAEADNESNNKLRPSDENLQKTDDLHTELETTLKFGETAELSQIKPNSLSAKCVVSSSDNQNGNLSPTNENSDAKSGSPVKHLIPSDLHSQNEAAWYSNAQEEYNQLLDKYYELEGQRQQVLQQLNQYNNWNYQHPIPSTSTSQEYQTSIPLPYDAVTCYCPYGCQNWVVPNSSVPDSCTGNACVGNSCNNIPRESQPGNPVPREEHEFVKTAMLAAERALSSLKSFAKEANGVKDKQLGVEIDDFAESTKSTDLDVVLNAWYSVGFYTGKYLSEQSMEKRKHGQGL
ncbi:hypothetical protein CASFOL_006030 [Castilleja foliolosa]|uniref:Survival Motor Neuron Gemin2-binding domain-containing protein n=1 Tax=Castilleja foliolosa TaxID=1961234 RepID=A0ABD3E773_9LAMI